MDQPGLHVYLRISLLEPLFSFFSFIPQGEKEASQGRAFWGQMTHILNEEKPRARTCVMSRK